MVRSPGPEPLALPQSFLMTQSVSKQTGLSFRIHLCQNVELLFSSSYLLSERKLELTSSTRWSVVLLNIL